MEWTIAFHDAFESEFAGLPIEAQDELLAHAKVLAEYKGLRPVITLSKPIDVSEIRAVLGSQESC